MVSEKMAKKFGFSFVSEDEIGFLTLYFIRYLELHKSKIQAVIMCSSGIGISELLKMKIEKTFDSKMYWKLSRPKQLMKCWSHVMMFNY